MVGYLVTEVGSKDVYCTSHLLSQPLSMSSDAIYTVEKLILALKFVVICCWIKFS